MNEADASLPALVRELADEQPPLGDHATREACAAESNVMAGLCARFGGLRKAGVGPGSGPSQRCGAAVKVGAGRVSGGAWLPGGAVCVRARTCVCVIVSVCVCV